jgi:hypothetical protein
MGAAGHIRALNRGGYFVDKLTSHAGLQRGISGWVEPGDPDIYTLFIWAGLIFMRCLWQIIYTISID